METSSKRQYGKSHRFTYRAVCDVLRTLHWDVPKTSYFNVVRTLVEDVIKMSVGDVPWRYLEYHMEKSIGRLLGRPQDVLGT